MTPTIRDHQRVFSRECFPNEQVRMPSGLDSIADYSKMRAVPTWVDKVHDRDKVEQWFSIVCFDLVNK